MLVTDPLICSGGISFQVRPSFDTHITPPSFPPLPTATMRPSRSAMAYTMACGPNGDSAETRSQVLPSLEIQMTGRHMPKLFQSFG